MDTDTLMEGGPDVSGLPDVHLDPNRLCFFGVRKAGNGFSR